MPVWAMPVWASFGLLILVGVAFPVGFLVLGAIFRIGGDL